MIETPESLSKQELIQCYISYREDSQKTISQLTGKVVYLEHQIALLQKALFGSKSEKLQQVVPSEQQQMDFGEKLDLDLPQDIEQQQITYHRRRPKKTREDYSKLQLPDTLERVVTVIEPEGKTDEMVKISEEVTELLAITPQKFYVKKIVRPKYSMPNKEGVLIAQLPSRAVQGGMVDVSFLVMLLLDKYVDHLPLYRQLKKYERLGMKLTDSTVGHWVAETLKLMELLFDELVKQTRGSPYLQADETPIRVLDKVKKGRTHLGYYWVYHDVPCGMVLFDYNASRGQVAPSEFLSGYKGYLQTDGYVVYDTLAGKDIILAGCMAHARRKFHEAQQNDHARASWMLEKLGLLYQVESIAREEQLNHQKRLALRKEKSIPVLEEMKQWLLAQCVQVLPQSPIGKAINYMLGRWDKLIRYTESGMLEIDNNLVENAIRPVALGRKNYLFAGSHDAAKRAGIIYSFIACCKKNGYDPYKWLEDTLTKLPDTKKSDLHKLLPLKKPDVV